MNDYLYADRNYHPLDEVCVKSANPDFKTALLTGRADAVRAWCRKNPRKLNRSFDWLTDSPKNGETKALIEREIGRRGRLQAIFISVVLAVVGIVVTQVARGFFR